MNKDTELLRLFDTLTGEKEERYIRIAQLKNLNADSVRSRVSRARRAAAQMPVNGATGGIREVLPSFIIDDTKTSPEPQETGKIIYFSVPTVDKEPQFPDMDALSDRNRWRKDLDELYHSKDVIVVAHPSDRHEPFIDKVADEMWYTWAAMAKPDIVVRGSDEDDLPTISKFAKEGAETPEIGDFLDVQYGSRRYHTKRTKLILPSALQPNIEGNHGWPRFIKWANTDAKHNRASTIRRYIENIRCDGAVYWIGNKVSVRIQQPLLVHHGRKAGLNAAKATLDMRNLSVSIMAGHTHRPDMYSVVGAKPVTCVIGGCLCLIPQDYNGDEDDSFSTWQHGTAVSTIDVKSGLCDVKEVRFHRANNRAWFEWGGQVVIFDVNKINNQLGEMAVAA